MAIFLQKAFTSLIYAHAGRTQSHAPDGQPRHFALRLPASGGGRSVCDLTNIFKITKEISIEN